MRTPPKPVRRLLDVGKQEETANENEEERRVTRRRELLLGSVRRRRRGGTWRIATMTRSFLVFEFGGGSEE